MSFLSVKNNAQSTLNSGISAGATSLTVASGEGAEFPTANFHITIDAEILKCTARSGDVLTVQRAQEGTSATSHDIGAFVRLNITTLHITELQDALAPSRARAYLGAAQTIPNTTWTKIQLNTESYDDDNQFDPVTNYRFTAQKAGWYLVEANLSYNPVVADKRYIMSIYKNGASVCNTGYHASQTGAIYAHTSEVVYLGVGDYVELWTKQEAGVDQTASPNSNFTYMGVHRLSA